MAKYMKRIGIFLIVFFAVVDCAYALKVSQHMETSIGVFDACKQTLIYSFDNNSGYDIKTTLETTGTFGTLYPFKAMYNTVGEYKGLKLKPLSYFQTAQSRFNYRTKKIVYEKGVPQYRVSTKNQKKRQDNIVVDNSYEQSIDLLSVFGVLIEQIKNNHTCDLQSYSFNGKRYSKSTVATIGEEEIATKYFFGKALKCKYLLEILDDATAGFMLNKEEPIYFWVLNDKATKAPFVAKVSVENTPFGKLESITTKVEAIK